MRGPGPACRAKQIASSRRHSTLIVSESSPPAL